MKSGTIVIVVGLALVVGIAVGLTVGFRMLQDAARQGNVTVLVALAEIRQGTILTDPEKLFVSKQFPADAVPPNAITDMRELQGKQALRTLDAGQICTQRHVGKYEGLEHGGSGLRRRRAMTIRIKCDQSNGVLLLPGTRVDVLATLPSKDAPTGKITKVVLPNTVLLAAPDFDKNSMMLVTVAVWPAEAEKLTRYAAESVTLTILLRKPEDDVKAPEPREN